MCLLDAALAVTHRRPQYEILMPERNHAFSGRRQMRYRVIRLRLIKR